MDGEQPTECWCPRCGKKHKRKIFFTGRGVPKFYCKECMYHSDMREEDVFSLGTDESMGLVRLATTI